jgi:hypothetical protein
MDHTSFSRLRPHLTLGVTLVLLSLLTWQQLHGGVPAHSFLARDDFPRISNWWGVLVLPVLTWFLTGRVRARMQHEDGVNAAATFHSAHRGLVAALLYGAALATAFTFGQSDITSSLFFALPVIGIVLPIHRAEYVLGFVLGMTYTFGGVLPTVVASAMSAVTALLYLVLRPAVLWLLARIALLARRRAGA